MGRAPSASWVPESRPVFPAAKPNSPTAFGSPVHPPTATIAYFTLRSPNRTTPDCRARFCAGGVIRSKVDNGFGRRKTDRSEIHTASVQRGLMRFYEAKSRTKTPGLLCRRYLCRKKGKRISFPSKWRFAALVKYSFSGNGSSYNSPECPYFADNVFAFHHDRNRRAAWTSSPSPSLIIT
jgi:hypothetical protein